MFFHPQPTVEPPAATIQNRRTVGPTPRITVAVVAAVLALSACGGGTTETATKDALAFTDTEQTEATTLVVPENAVPETTALEADDGEPIETTTTEAPPLPTAPPSKTPTTEARDLSPVTTIAVGSGGDPQGIYRGQIGKLSLDQIVVPGVAPAPSGLPGVAPLTGLAPGVTDRPAAVVKIDNGSAAIPQQGLNAADIVIEEEVEGGLTRFAAIFHTNPTVVGPVRSGRTTDLSLISSLGRPLLIYSGANQITEGILRSNTDIQNRSHGSSSGYWREGSRRAPSNLFSDVAAHWLSAEGGSPVPQFAYRYGDEPVPGEAAAELSITYRATNARWEWDGTNWLRWQRGSVHKVVSGEQISAANVVVIETERVSTGMTDSSGGAVPEFPYVGTGTATVFTDGKRIDGIWTRPSLTSVATLTTDSGDVIELTPGRTWIQLVEAGSGALS